MEHDLTEKELEILIIAVKNIRAKRETLENWLDEEVSDKELDDLIHKLNN